MRAKPRVPSPRVVGSALHMCARACVRVRVRACVLWYLESLRWREAARLLGDGGALLERRGDGRVVPSGVRDRRRANGGRQRQAPDGGGGQRGGEARVAVRETQRG